MERVMLYPKAVKMVSYWNKFKIENKQQQYRYYQPQGFESNESGVQRVGLIYTQENRTNAPIDYYILPNHPAPEFPSSYNSGGTTFFGDRLYSSDDTSHNVSFGLPLYHINKVSNLVSAGDLCWKGVGFYPCIQTNDSKYDEGPTLKKVIKEYM